jgi:hypothetical protein
LNRTNPTFKQAKLSEDEANAFLDEMFSNLFDQNDFFTDADDKIPDLGRFEP